MPKKIVEMENSSQRLNANDYAIVEFGRYRGFGYKHIAMVIGRSEKSVGQMGYWINKFHEGSLPINDPKYPTIQEALVLEAQVRGGRANHMKQLWINKLNKAKGEAIATVVRDELIEKGEIEVEEKQEEMVVEPEREEEVPTEEATTDGEAEEGLNLEIHEQPLVSFSVQINESQILKILNMFFTK